MELAVNYPAYFQTLKQERTIAAHDAHTDPRTKEFSSSIFLARHYIHLPIWLDGEMVELSVTNMWDLSASGHWRNRISLAL